MVCAHCGYKNGPGQGTCANCGRPLVASSNGESERKLVTMLFADIVGSTAAAEKLDPEDWGEIVSGVHSGVIEAVERYDGTVVQLLGDGVLAFFGAPAAHEDDAERAVRAALEIQAFMAEHGASLPRLSEPLQMRIGLHTGLVVVGNMGSGRHVEYLAVGDSVNTAARMQSAAEPGTVLISSDTYRSIKHAFDARSLGEIEVKGKSAPVFVYQVLAARSSRGNARGLEGLDAPLVGRDVELGALRDRVEALRSGHGAFVAVLGEAGIGKSRLLAELRRWIARGPEVQWLEARSLSYSQSDSYFPWRQILRGSIGAGDGDPPAAVGEKLRASGLSTPERIPFVEAMLAVESPESLAAAAAYEGDALVEQIAGTAREYLRRLAAKAPAILVFDDAHWIDGASANLLASLAGLPAEAPLLIICVQRPEKEGAGREALNRAREAAGSAWFELALEPLPPDISQQLLEKLLPIRQLPAALRDLILARSEGNPFYLEEVLRGLIDGGYLERENSHWRVRQEVAEVTIPETLAGVLAARIDRLPEDTKRVAQMAAVLGRIFAYRVLEGVCDTAPPSQHVADLGEHLAALTREEILRERAREPELEFIFKHALTQEAAYNSLLLKRRREFHRRAALTLEKLYADRLAEYAPAIALHFRHAEEWAAAAEYALRAGAASMKVFARAEALTHYELVLEAYAKLPEVPYEQVIDTTFTWAGIAAGLRPYEQQLERLAHAEELARQHGDRRRLALALTWIGNAHMARGFPTRAYGPLSESYHLASDVGDEIVSVLPNWVMGWTMINTDPRGALARLQRVVDLAREQRNPEMEALALASKAMAHARVGESDAAERDSGAALQLAGSIRSPLKVADVNLLAGFTYLDLGDIERGLRYSQRGLEVALAADGLQCAAWASYCQGLGRLQTGETSGAITAFSESVKLAERSLGDYLPGRGMHGYDVAAEQMANQGRSGLAIARYFAGDAAALDDIASALAAAQALGDGFMAAVLQETLGQIYVGLGEPARAEAYLAAALAYYHEAGMAPYVARAERLLAAARPAQAE